jgi:hypothetical protein
MGTSFARSRSKGHKVANLSADVGHGSPTSFKPKEIHNEDIVLYSLRLNSAVYKCVAGMEFLGESTNIYTAFTMMNRTPFSLSK